MTRERLETLAETAEERTKDYLRAALKDPLLKEVVHRRYVPLVLTGPAVANDVNAGTDRDAKQA